MARICNPKAENQDFVSEAMETQNILMNCQLKLKYPPENSSGSFLPALRQLKQVTGEINKGLGRIQNLRGDQNPRCCWEEWKKISKLRKKKILDKLKRVYEIDAEGLREHTMNEIIRKMQMLEKEKRDREKRKADKTVVMIKKLIEDQRYKRRGWGTKLNKLPWKKSLKSFSSTEALCESTAEETSEKFEREIVEEEEEQVSQLQPQFRMQVNEITLKDEEKKSIEGKEEVVLLPEDLQVQDVPDVAEKQSITEKISIEKHLQSTPTRVVFQDFKKDKVYYQDLTVTNVGLDKIHCRLLGVGVYKSEERFPVGVAVRDSVKLRPGCSYSTKVRFCVDDNTREIACSIVYETRRKVNPNKHSWFLIPVLCIPARAVIKVTPFKIVFPSITWCIATGAEGDKALKKVLRIQNTGAKGCLCKISKQSLYVEEEVGQIMGEDRIIGEETSTEKTYMTENKISRPRTQDESDKENQELSKEEEGEQEFHGENFYVREEATNAAYSLVEELFGNVFANFRFSEKYHIEIPPFSTKLVEVRFIPEYRGFHHENQFIQFEGCYNCLEEKIELMGDIVKLPLRLEPQVIDLKTCVANSGVYSDIFKIFNDSKGPYMVRLKIPSSVKNHAHIYPRTAIIQPFSSHEFSVRIYPRVTLATDAPRFYSELSGIFEFPVFVHPANFDACKSDYIKLYVCALITNYALELEPPNIDLGTVNTLETVWTEITLTNHSLAAQEFGFLNLPKGVRIEPNMGFGTILPKETIPLFFLYSPGRDVLKSSRKQGDHFFNIKVTSIAEYGGFREKLLPESEPWEPFESTWQEISVPKLDQIPETTYSESGDEEVSSDEKSEDYAFCEDTDFSIELEELNRRLNKQEEKIRDFLKGDPEVSEHSFRQTIRRSVDREPSAYVFLKNRRAETSSIKSLRNVPGVIGEEDEGEGNFEKSDELRVDMNLIKCGAFVVVPFCQFSESLIQLPATPCSSVSLYCFRLECGTIPDATDCNCGPLDKRKSFAALRDGVSFAGRFEFQCDCPHIKLEPNCGFFKAGDSLPITIIYRPEFPAEQLYRESKALKAKKVEEEKPTEKETIFLKGTGVVKRGRSQTVRLTMEKFPEIYDGDDISDSLGDLNSNDFFAGERNLQKFFRPFIVEAKVRCVIKVVQRDNPTPRTEVHNMMIICPAIKPNFVYLGRSQEINFGKVLVGTRPKIPLKIQNISFDRITPVMSFLNPIGPFSCPAALRRTKVDPEHVWTQPLMYAPLQARGIEREFFEIYSGRTNLFLMVTGEAVMPEYKFKPNFSYCWINVSPGQSTDIQLDIENDSQVKMNLKFVCEFLKESAEGEEEEKPPIVETNVKPNKKGKKEAEPKKKIAETEKRSIKFLDEIPEEIWMEVKTFKDLKRETSGLRVFSLVGVNVRDEIEVAPNAKSQVKIRFSPPKLSTKKYAVKYNVNLEGITFLKEILVVGTSLKGKLSP